MDQKQFEQMQEDVAAIRRALMGEKIAGNIGLVQRVEKMEKKLAKADLRNAAITGGVTVAVFVGKYLLMGN